MTNVSHEPNILPLPKKVGWLDRFYYIGVIIKGFDGAVELLTGLFLAISPQLVHLALQGIAMEVGEKPGHIRQFLAEYLANADIKLAAAGTLFLVLYLLVHAVVKLVMVYCLIRRIRQAYPPALAILTLFLIYQVYVLIESPSIAFALLTVFDAVIIWLVYREYKHLDPEDAKLSKLLWPMRKTKDPR